MFEELYRNRGVLLCRSGYKDGNDVFTEIPVVYFVQDRTTIGTDGAAHALTQIFCKPAAAAMPSHIMPDSRFRSHTGEICDLQSVAMLRDHFSNVLEAVVLTVAQ